MAKPKAKTLMEKLGFFDDDLRSPVHDDILKWCEANASEIITEVFNVSTFPDSMIEKLRNSAAIKHARLLKEGQDCVNMKRSRVTSTAESLQAARERLEDVKRKVDEGRPHFDADDISNQESNVRGAEKTHNDSQAELEKYLRKLQMIEDWNGLGDVPPRSDFEVAAVEWEYIVTSQSTNASSGYKSSKGVIGAVDMRYTLKVTRLDVKGLDSEFDHLDEPLAWEERGGDDRDTVFVYIEAKTRIPSLGELFRQVNIYRVYVKGPFIVISPDDKDADTIQRQNIYFLKYPDPRAN